MRRCREHGHFAKRLVGCNFRELDWVAQSTRQRFFDHVTLAGQQEPNVLGDHALLQDDLARCKTAQHHGIQDLLPLRGTQTGQQGDLLELAIERIGSSGFVRHGSSRRAMRRTHQTGLS